MIRTRTSQDGMALDEMNNAMPPEEIKELKRTQKEGLNGFEYLRRTKKCKTPLQKKMKNYLRFEMREEKILELHQQNLDELWKNELNREEPP